MRYWIYTISILVILLIIYICNRDNIADRVEEHKPRDWNHYCTVENPDSHLCWAGKKAPWVGGPFCHNIPRTEKNQAPGTAVRCRVKKS